MNVDSRIKTSLAAALCIVAALFSLSQCGYRLYQKKKVPVEPLTSQEVVSEFLAKGLQRSRFADEFVAEMNKGVLRERIPDQNYIINFERGDGDESDIITMYTLFRGDKMPPHSEMKNMARSVFNRFCEGKLSSKMLNEGFELKFIYTDSQKNKISDIGHTVHECPERKTTAPIKEPG